MSEEQTDDAAGAQASADDAPERKPQAGEAGEGRSSRTRRVKAVARIVHGLKPRDVIEPGEVGELPASDAAELVTRGLAEWDEDGPKAKPRGKGR